MKVSEVIVKLQEMKMMEAEVLIALPGGRFSPATLVERYAKVDEDKNNVTVALIYPHPRDVSGPSAAPAGDRPEWVKGIDAVFDFLAGDGEKKEGKE